ncbi:hypothetical protein MG293_001914 [Ovis ammon polii]|uniref:Uncharacterized protein n=1 Tax=Ovis ammon polii TaxID=230172 RepID=A0AAD4UQT3_OVIAM|nr:hypothetical protein MG293_001914 [Ovis ammon polii]
MTEQLSFLDANDEGFSVKHHNLQDEGDISTLCNLVLGLSHHDLDMCPSQQSTTFITELEVKGYWAYGFEVNQMKFIFKILRRGSICNGDGNGIPLQYSCLEDPMDGGAWVKISKYEMGREVSKNIQSIAREMEWPFTELGKLSNPTVTCFSSSNHSIVFQDSDSMGFPGSISKESVCNAGDPGSMLSGISLGEGNGNPLQYSCLENSMDRGPAPLDKRNVEWVKVEICSPVDYSLAYRSHPDKRVIFNIVNFSKTKSLYRDGMAPMVKSTSRPKWHNSLHWRFKRKVSAPATKRVWASDEATYNALSSNRIPILVISIGFFGIGTLGVWNPDVDA